MTFWVCDSKRWKRFCTREIQAKATNQATIEPNAFKIFPTPSAFVEYDIRFGRNNIDKLVLPLIRCVGFLIIYVGLARVGVSDDVGYGSGFRVSIEKSERVLEVIRMCYPSRTLITTVVELHTAGCAVDQDIILLPHSIFSAARTAPERNDKVAVHGQVMMRESWMRKKASLVNFISHFLYWFGCDIYQYVSLNVYALFHHPIYLLYSSLWWHLEKWNNCLDQTKIKLN